MHKLVLPRTQAGQTARADSYRRPVSACYLAAGKPVIIQDTAFDAVISTGEGLFAFNTMEDIVATFTDINSDYERHSRAARAFAEEYFGAESILEKIIDDLRL